MSDSRAEHSAGTAYEGFLTALGREPAAAECLEWAQEHTGDPEQGRALVDAGWLTSRTGQAEEALALFHRAAGLAGESGRDAQVGIIDQLYALGRDTEAQTALRELRTDLNKRPGDGTDLRIFDNLTEALSDAGQYEQALEWCQAGLDRAAELGDLPEIEDHRRGLLISRGFLREELGIELDEDDRAVQAEADAALTKISELLHHRLNETPPRTLDIPDDGEPFDAIVLRWVRQDFPAIRARWPKETAQYSDDYATYATLVEREARGYADAGAHRIHLVSGTLADYETFARLRGRDPAQAGTRRDFGEWALTHRPGQASRWPRGRNAPCWCDSGRKYKKCCGSPANS